MPKHVKLLLTTLTAAIVLAGLVGTASARRFEISNQLIRVTWSSLRFAERTAAGGLEVRCPVTLEGSFHSKTLSKVCGQLVGLISRAALTRAACTFNNNAESIEILAPEANRVWRLLYVGFVGPLPNITTIILKLIRASFRLGAFGVGCLYESTNASSAQGSTELEAGGGVTGLRALNEHRIPKHEGSELLCPGSGIFEGAGTVTQLGSSTGIVIKLVQ